MIGLLAICTTELVATLYAILNRNRHYLRALVVLNMVLIMVFAPYLISFGDVVVNIGVVFYATVMGLQAYLLLNYGKDAAVETINKLTYVLFTLLSICFFIQYLPVLPGNEEVAQAIKLLTNYSVLTLFGAFFAFILEQLTLVYIYTKLKFHRLLNIFLALVLAQLVDSLFFFGIAFYDNPNLMELIISGWLVKVALHIITFPVLLISKYE